MSRLETGIAIAVAGIGLAGTLVVGLAGALVVVGLAGALVVVGLAGTLVVGLAGMLVVGLAGMLVTSIATAEGFVPDTGRRERIIANPPTTITARIATTATKTSIRSSRGRGGGKGEDVIKGKGGSGVDFSGSTGMRLTGRKAVVLTPPDVPTERSLRGSGRGVSGFSGRGGASRGVSRRVVSSGAVSGRTAFVSRPRYSRSNAVRTSRL